MILYILLFISILEGGRIRPSTDFEGAALPLKLNPREWVSLKEIDRHEQNFTVFNDDDFAEIKRAYLDHDLVKLEKALLKAYAFIEHRVDFPSLLRLKLENFYLHVPWLALLFLSLLVHRAPFIVLTTMLLLRMAILGRPPVTSMYETLLFVPWVIALLGLLFKQRNTLLLLAFFSILYFTDHSPHLETLQPVLNSQLWLTIHVLMVVGSYGIFALASLLGHLYLLKPTQSKLLLKMLYLGVIALTAGTLLGGVWAAQSWGRFWDWDPKESWAFISISFYLVAIHLYRFGKIGMRGLAVGSVVGFLAISFCWYGVNYLLGTGLHSYGFGTGGVIYYLIFIALEVLFLLFALTTMKKRKILRPQ